MQNIERSALLPIKSPGARLLINTHTCPDIKYTWKFGADYLYGPLCDHEGRPLAVVAYPGNTATPPHLPVRTLKSHGSRKSRKTFS